MLNPATPTVLVDPSLVERFLDTAVHVYDSVTADHPLSCFAVLLGTIAPGAVHVHQLAFGRNARTMASAAVDEFATTIVPRFGSAYDNTDRGFWLDPADLLRISRESDRVGLDLLGAIHMHPDWHRITRVEAERAVPLSSAPTLMDIHVFGCAGWPVNLICYLEKVNDVISYDIGAWSPEGTALPLRILVDRGRLGGAA